MKYLILLFLTLNVYSQQYTRCYSVDSKISYMQPITFNFIASLRNFNTINFDSIFVNNLNKFKPNTDTVEQKKLLCDFKSNYSTFGSVNRFDSIKVHIVNIPDNINYLDFKKALESCLDLWCSLTEKSYKLNYTYENANLIISTTEIDGKLGVLGRANSPTNSYRYKTFIELDGDESWSADDPLYNNYYQSIWSVLSHELGHTFGLGHSEKENQLMSPYVSSSWGLQEDDLKAVNELYKPNILNICKNTDGLVSENFKYREFYPYKSKSNIADSINCVSVYRNVIQACQIIRNVVSVPCYINVEYIRNNTIRSVSITCKDNLLLIRKVLSTSNIFDNFLKLGVSISNFNLKDGLTLTFNIRPTEINSDKPPNSN